ncbi:hypothetical protein AU210_015696 [Fusarium oxysporum f. sp. radicis-cucumerinum]|uniref:Uncharacterized protein n=1 Tax=Fusarium oxysporum f. sp. radicis-cucumerinum TaxID=327505 RepID=A0A2H3G878_FUSOX|nr:hypothetical protein AU210_015696 [Fusarium oxysporum f. sp. radicis-cucumerinum]
MGEVLNLKQFYQASAPLSTSESEAFIQTIWRPSRELNMLTLSSYFEFLETERKRESRVDNRAYSQLCFKHVFDVHRIIYENPDKPTPDLQALVQNRLSPFNLEPEVLEDVIILVIRLVFMVRIEFQNPSHPSPFQLQMQVTQSFQETLSTLQIGPPLREWSMQHELPSWFNVIDLKRKANRNSYVISAHRSPSVYGGVSNPWQFLFLGIPKGNAAITPVIFPGNRRQIRRSGLP